MINKLHQLGDIIFYGVYKMIGKLYKDSEFIITYTSYTIIGIFTVLVITPIYLLLDFTLNLDFSRVVYFIIFLPIIYYLNKYIISTYNDYKIKQLLLLKKNKKLIFQIDQYIMFSLFTVLIIFLWFLCLTIIPIGYGNL